MLKKHDLKENLLKLSFTKFDLEVNIENGDFTYINDKKKKEFAWPGEYEADGIQFLSIEIPNEETKLLNVIDGKSILILPKSPKYEKLFSDEVISLLPNIEIIILHENDSSDDLKKIIQLLEPRVLVKLNGKIKTGEESLEELSENKMSFPDDATKIYCI